MLFNELIGSFVGADLSALVGFSTIQMKKLKSIIVSRLSISMVYVDQSRAAGLYGSR